MFRTATIPLSTGLLDVMACPAGRESGASEVHARWLDGEEVDERADDSCLHTYYEDIEICVERISAD